MKILAISSGPRKNGNSKILCDEFLYITNALIIVILCVIIKICAATHTRKYSRI